MNLKEHESKYLHIKKKAIKGIIYMLPCIILCTLIILGHDELLGEAVGKWEVAPYKSAFVTISAISGFFASIIVMFYGFAEIVNDE